MLRQGQVLVEMLLILPVFLMIVFGIMELGYIAFQTIVLNHATYEVARIAAMTRASASTGQVTGDCEDLLGLMQRMLGPQSRVDCKRKDTGMDAQAQMVTYDVVATGTNKIPLIFPISSIFLADTPTSGMRTITATVPMPIEQPLQY